MLTGISFSIRGQGDSIGATKENVLYLNIKNLNFVRNNEYSNPIIEGYTLIGYFLQPELTWSPSKKITLRLGTHLLNYSGTDKFTVAKPVFSTSYNISENMVLRAGTLAGSETHKMYDPHFNRERMYTNNAEEGLQFTFVNDHIFSDAWVSWENFIFKGDTAREIFSAGESFRYSSSLIGGLFRFEIPVQVQFKHFGGQISDYPERVETYFNISAGTRISIDLNSRGNEKAGFEYLIFSGRKLTGITPGDISYGDAEWYKLFYSRRLFDFELGYWESNDFFAPDGNYIYGSVSGYRDISIGDRTLITGSAMMTLRPEHFFELCLGFEGFYDISSGRFDNAVMLHLRFDRLIKIVSIKDR